MDGCIFDAPRLFAVFGFFSINLSRKAAMVMSRSGSPAYTTGSPDASARAIAATDGCACAVSATSSHQPTLSAWLYVGSRLAMSYASSEGAAAAPFASALLGLAAPPLLSPSPPSGRMSTKRSMSSSRASSALRIAPQSAGFFLSTSERRTRAPHANVAGACAATCSSRFANAGTRAGAFPSAVSALKRRLRKSGALVARGSVGDSIIA
mmetsp:Transcript_1644/g.6034  ORF Transcript_1644/g.6034 Transcript_1644/m.6034 type:complete len:209 (-) Transcript_1644:1435-2061(-)